MPIKLSWLRRLVVTASFCLILLSIPVNGYAQSGFYLMLYPPDLDGFPKVTLFVDAYDAQGQFIPSLNLNRFSVLEDGIERSVNETQLIEPGLHTIVALNLGATLSNRTNTSVPTRFEEAVFAVADWLNGLASSAQNQYSLTSNEGILAENVQDQLDFTYQLQNYKPNLFNFQPDFTSLTLALDTAEKPNLISQSKQAILYITPLPLDQSLNEIPALQARALEIGVPLHIWLMAPDTAANSPAVEALSQLSAATGGTFLHYAEGTAMPNPEDFVGRLRNVYRLRYTSEISQSGTHTVQVKATYGSQSVMSEKSTFDIDLNLPTIYLKDLPAEISRKYENSDDGRVLQPNVVTIAAEVVFPDGYERQLEATRFYVDGELIAENMEEPFNFFGWSLETYQFSGEHLVSAEVEDILGFRSISPPVSVMVNVESPYPQWVTGTLRFFMGGGWVILAVLVLGGSVYAGLRLRKRLAAAPSNYGSSQIENIDPLEQPVPGLGYDWTEGEYGIRPGIQQQYQQDTPPRLIRENDDPSVKQKVLKIDQPQMIIGSNPEQCAFVIDSPVVSPQHARLVRSESGAVTIADLGSNSGTWVNYAPVSTAGTILNHGDLVRIGKTIFRYQIGTFR